MIINVSYNLDISEYELSLMCSLFRKISEHTKKPGFAKTFDLTEDEAEFIEQFLNAFDNGE